MPGTEHVAISEHRRARATAESLRARFAAIGLPPDVVAAINVRHTRTGGPCVVIPDPDPDAADLLLAALTGDLAGSGSPTAGAVS